MARIEIAKEDRGRPDALARAVDRASNKRAIEVAVMKERVRCLNIARFAEQHCNTDVGSSVARAIAEAIIDDAIG